MEVEIRRADFKNSNLSAPFIPALTPFHTNTERREEGTFRSGSATKNVWAPREREGRQRPGPPTLQVSVSVSISPSLFPRSATLTSQFDFLQAVQRRRVTEQRAASSDLQ